MKAILIVIDGMRPDALEPARTPNLCRLMDAGAHTLVARTVSPSITLPCHASLFLSLPPEQHGVGTNVWTAASPRPVGLVEALQQAGLRTAFFFNWEELRDLAPPGSLHASFCLNNCAEPNGDLELADLAAGWLQGNDVDLAFLYLGYTDNAGHEFGWMSEKYLSALSRADIAAGRVLAVLPGDVTVVVCSDHGGRGTSHGTECDENLTIPVIVAGHPELPSGSRLADPVSIMDVAPTLVALLGAGAPVGWKGRDLAAAITHDRTVVSREAAYREVTYVEL